MDPEYFRRVPNFLDKDEWVEERVADFYFDPKSGGVRYCGYGSGPEGLVVGMAIFKINAKDSKLWLIEYRGKQGEDPYVLLWGVKNEWVNGSAIALANRKGWVIKPENHFLGWEINYDSENKILLSVRPYFEPVTLPPMN